MTNEEVWQLVLDNQRLLRREVRRYAPRDVEECYSEVVLGRAVSIMKTYEPRVGVLPITHLCACVRWYAYKYARRKQHKQEVPDSAVVYDDDPNFLLDGLDEEDQNLLRWRFIEDYSIAELAEHYKISKREVNSRLDAALERAKVRHGQM